LAKKAHKQKEKKKSGSRKTEEGGEALDIFFTRKPFLILCEIL